MVFTTTSLSSTTKIFAGVPVGAPADGVGALTLIRDLCVSCVFSARNGNLNFTSVLLAGSVPKLAMNAKHNLWALTLARALLLDCGREQCLLRPGRAARRKGRRPLCRHCPAL